MEKSSSELALPDSVFASRKHRLRAMVSVGVQGIAIRSFIVVGECVGYAFFKSATLLFDAIGSLIDIAVSLSLLFFIRIADKPPDDDHPLGHGRYEPIAGMQLAILLVLIGCGLFGRQVFLLFRLPALPPLNRWVWLIPLGAVLLLEWAYRRLSRIAKQQRSSALFSEALHYRIDAMSSLVATIALAAGAVAAPLSPLFDQLGALIIGLVMALLGCFAARQNMHQLVDRVPEKHYFDLVRTAALKVSGVKATEKLRIQLYGPDAHVSIDIEVAPILSVIEAHLIAQKVRLEIQKCFPAVRDAIVHVEPHLTTRPS
ncbi:MAG: cation diffusion facilitator family transporter [Chlamydiota bacterium]